jgi:DNA-binding NarL/FixJ family response regulator
VLDISMPGMSGLEVAATLRQRGSTAALVFLTVHDDEDFVLAAREAGGTGYVVKRRLTFDLLSAVQEASAGRSFVSTSA